MIMAGKAGIYSESWIVAGGASEAFRVIERQRNNPMLWGVLHESLAKEAHEIINTLG